MADEPKSEKYLDRYEVVAVALPGAALLLFVWYLRPELFGAAKFELKDITVGALGIFTIAALIAGQVVQAVANLVEEVLNQIADLGKRSPVASLPPHRRRKFADVVKSLEVDDPENIDRRRYRRELGKEISRTARQRDTTGMLQVSNVSYGLHRGLAVAAGVGLLLALLDKSGPRWSAFAIIFAATAYRAVRFSRRYEGESLRLFLDTPPKPDGGA
jgi:hypothetical protein